MSPFLSCFEYISALGTLSNRVKVSPDTNPHSERQISNRVQRGETAQIVSWDRYLTDKGSLIPILSRKPIHCSKEEIALGEVTLALSNYKKISDYDPSYNCHSYVFTDGKAKGWISEAKSVEKILKENGFRKVASGRYDNSDYTSTEPPKKDDIVIYRGKFQGVDNLAKHSGIIHKPNKDPNETIVRSKMAEYGIFLHTLTNRYMPNFMREITHWEIYHTDRPQGRFITETSSKHEGDHQ